jgi:hypothetical protein
MPLTIIVLQLLNSVFTTEERDRLARAGDTSGKVGGYYAHSSLLKQQTS